MKKIIAYFLVIVLVFGCCACGNSTAKKKKKKVIIIDDSTVTSSDINDDSSGEYTEDNNWEENNWEENTVEYATKKVSAFIGDRYYSLKPEIEHPGVVGYNANYTMVAKDRRGRSLEASRMVMHSDTQGIIIKENIITIPYSIRKKGKPVTISLYDSKYPNRKGNYIFTFRQFTEEPTFADEFDTLNKDVWSENWYPGNIYGEVKDGILSLNVTSKEDKSMDISTSGKFKQSFGCFSANIKMPDRGVNNTGFWLCTDYNDPNDPNSEHEEGLRNPYRPSQSGTEVDVIEYSAAWDSRYSSTCHWYGWSGYHRSSGKEGITVGGVDLAADFHTYSLVWIEDHYYWYFDEHLVYDYTGEGVAYGPMVPILQVGNATSDGWLGTFENVYPYTGSFDWIRIYGLKDIDWTKTAYGKEYVYE